MANLGRPKRAAEDFLRYHGKETDNPQASKKPRFDLRNPSALAPDLPEDDGTLDADVIGVRGQQVRRNAVNIDGYDSDSENEGFAGQAAAKAKAKDDMSKDEEAADIFADLEDDLRDEDDSVDDGKQTSQGKKAVRFLDADEIEGQVANSKSGGHVSTDFTPDRSARGSAGGLQHTHTASREQESSSESEVDDETRDAAGEDVDDELGAGAKKTHAPKLDAFNMRNEQDEGRFDDQGNYVRKAVDPDAVHDIWLAGLSKKDMRQAKEAADKREEERRRVNMDKDSVASSDALKSLIPHLEKGETVLEALARLNQRKNRKPRWQKNKNRKSKDTDMMTRELNDDNQRETTRKETVEAITESADLLLRRDQPEIYNAERGFLVRQYRQETGEEWSEPAVGQAGDDAGSRSSLWEYRWADARDGGQIHGPYEGDIMKQWNEAGYFGEGVEFKKADDTGEWSRIVDF